MASGLTLLIIAVPVLALSIAIHEMTHALVGDRLGDNTARLAGRVSLNPFTHIDPILTVGLPLILLIMGLPPFGMARPVPFNPSRVKHAEFGVALVAISGPLSNLMLATVGGALYRLLLPNHGVLFSLLALVVQINVAFFIFNLIPFPPLDGSRVLYAFAPSSLQRLMERIESMGIISLAFFMFIIFPIIQPVFFNLSDSLLRILT